MVLMRIWSVPPRFWRLRRSDRDNGCPLDGTVCDHVSRSRFTLTGELDSGIVCASAASLRGRKPLENSLPDLEADLREMGEGACQTDPTFRTTQLYRRLTAA